MEPTAITPIVALEKMLGKLTGEQRSIMAKIQTGATLHRDLRPGYLRENGQTYNEWPITTDAPFTARYVRVAAVEPMIDAALLVSADTFIWAINPAIVAALTRSAGAAIAPVVEVQPIAAPVVEEPPAALVDAETITADGPTVAAKTAQIAKLLNTVAKPTTNAAKVRKAAKS